MTSYFIALIDIHDRAGYQRYLDGFDTVFDRYNREVVAVDESPMTLEGRWPAKRTVLIRFPTEEDPLRWYRSPEYQRLASVRAAAASAIPVRALKLESYDYDGHDDRALGLTPLGRPPPRVLTTAATADSRREDQRPTLVVRTRLAKRLERRNTPTGAWVVRGQEVSVPHSVAFCCCARCVHRRIQTRLPVSSGCSPIVPPIVRPGM